MEPHPINGCQQGQLLGSGSSCSVICTEESDQPGKVGTYTCPLGGGISPLTTLACENRYCDIVTFDTNEMQGVSSTCTKWRATNNGDRDPENDRECSTVIATSETGYCECGDGRTTTRKDGEDTCAEACVYDLKPCISGSTRLLTGGLDTSCSVKCTATSDNPHAIGSYVCNAQGLVSTSLVCSNKKCGTVKFPAYGMCVSWRETSGCDQDGEREPENDLPCSATIATSQSGFCECGDGRKTMSKSCDTQGSYTTCAAACASTAAYMVGDAGNGAASCTDGITQLDAGTSCGVKCDSESNIGYVKPGSGTYQCPAASIATTPVATTFLDCSPSSSYETATGVIVTCESNNNKLTFLGCTGVLTGPIFQHGAQRLSSTALHSQ